MTIFRDVATQFTTLNLINKVCLYESKLYVFRQVTYLQNYVSSNSHVMYRRRLPSDGHAALFTTNYEI